MIDYVIVANGPFPPKNLILEAIHGKQIVALDGAANQLKALGIMPHVILGDFDSLDKTTQHEWGITQLFNEMTPYAKPYSGKHGVLIVPDVDQHETDLVKAIRYCDQHHANHITIICATGGREDHHEGTKMALRTEYKAYRKIIVHTEQQSLCYAINESVILNGRKDDYCGFIATNTGYGTSRGLLYECTQHESSICNRLKSTSATLCIEGGALVILPPQLMAQQELTQAIFVQNS